MGAHLRTALTSALAARTGWSLKWKRQATPCGRSWWVLRMPAPPTDDFGPGWWDFDAISSTAVPTPLGSDNFAGGKSGRQKMRDLGIMPLVPTPTKQDYGSNQGGAAGRTGKVRPSLRQMLLTPTAKANTHSPSMEKWSGGAAVQSLLTQLGTGGVTVPTPIARDHRSPRVSAETLAKNSRPLNESLGLVGLTDPVLLHTIYGLLMGFPAGWLLPIEEINAASQQNSLEGEQPTVTLSHSQSSRRS